MDIEEIGFGDFCTIEQKRYVGPNEFYGYKVVGRKKSNAWTDVPVDANNEKETRHDYMDDVVTVVCNNLDDRNIYQFRVSDLASVKKAQAVQEWISVDDEPPTPNKTFSEAVIAWDGVCVRRIPLCLFNSASEVTHWMPIPQPPKAQEPAND